MIGYPSSMTLIESRLHLSGTTQHIYPCTLPALDRNPAITIGTPRLLHPDKTFAPFPTNIRPNLYLQETVFEEDRW